MADSVTAPASYGTQADALLRKNLTYQKRNAKANCRLISVPIFLLLFLRTIEILTGAMMQKQSKCGCKCIDTNGTGKCEDKCGLEYSSPAQADLCEVKDPYEWQPILQIPDPEYSAVRTDYITYADLPNESCKMSKSCPAIVLLTGTDQTLGKSISENLLRNESHLDDSDDVEYSSLITGSTVKPEHTNFLDPAYFQTLYTVQSQCPPNFKYRVPVENFSEIDIKCREGLPLWRNNPSEINEELYKGYKKGNPAKKINEIVAAYDLLNTDRSRFNVSIWYNGTDRDSQPSPTYTRVPTMVNLVSNAFLQYLLGPDTNIVFGSVKEMPKHGSMKIPEVGPMGPVMFSWVILQLFPVVFVALVYEKQQRLRIMMKMHGLKDGPYWTITYAYFLVISSLYMLGFVGFGSVLNLKFFRYNAYSIQFVFYFAYINLQIAFAFLLAGFFSDVKTATVMGYMLVFASGLLGAFFFSSFITDTSISEGWVILLELYPGFSLYRGLFEFGEYSSTGSYTGEKGGMTWKNLNDPGNGMKETIIIMFLEWAVVLLVAFYLDQINSSGKSPLFFLRNSRKKQTVSTMNLLEKKESGLCLEMDKEDVAQERERVEQMLAGSTAGYPIVVDNLKKVYPGQDGNPDKYAVRGLSLAVPEGECLGMLGPNGAGKTSFISMMIGLTMPSSGAAFVDGLNINTEMDKVYTIMGVCPQHDLLWDTLTGREHLLFYGRLKNLKGEVLHQAVEDSLKSLNLFNGGVADKQAGRYSGGMKRRLSVAISLIGNPKVVYLDEPSTGLDPASRNTLWTVVKNARKGRAIILTTHSMEEADYLCDRLGIFVDGSLQCIGNSTELKARYGGSYVFAVTTSSDNEVEMENMVRRLCPNANRVYHLSGTQKFELPKHEVKIADVFQLVEEAKSRFTVHAWGMADTTLEDVFIKVARTAQSFNEV
ncbi:ABC transporter A family member 7-like [Lycium barbarum]|uniref:ABC transporter A family member 7-like n=1 Tax=Lycium barbarum TaxID=112863 RepID=UPI00293F1F5F|nr:ABC transporter A family member 7-like [Lycium barbarum]